MRGYRAAEMKKSDGGDYIILTTMIRVKSLL